jgi:hypothetical protein
VCQEHRVRPKRKASWALDNEKAVLQVFHALPRHQNRLRVFVISTVLPHAYLSWHIKFFHYIIPPSIRKRPHFAPYYPCAELSLYYFNWLNYNTHVLTISRKLRRKTVNEKIIDRYVGLRDGILSRRVRQ